jgi:hypothetical protein
MRTKQIKVCGQDYTMNFPTVGQFIDIKVLETNLSQGTMKQMILGNGDHLDAYLYITTYAHLSILCPQMIKDLKVKSMLDLSLEDYEELTQIYLTEIQPWIQEVRSAIRNKVTGENGPQNPEE